MDILETKLNEICDTESFFTAWYVEDLKTGNKFNRNGDVPTPSASTRKISIMMTVLQEVATGRLFLTEELLIDGRFKDNSSGCFQHFTGNFHITLHDAVVMMIIVSDNTCTGTIVERLGGLDIFNNFCRSVGMNHTVHRLPTGRKKHDRVEGGAVLDQTNITSASDVGHLLSLIVKGMNEDKQALQTLRVSSDLCQLAVQIMKWQRLNDRMPLLLPAYVSIAHKTGRNYKDAGIVFSREKEPLFVLTIYTDDVPQTLPDGRPGHWAASQLISTLTRMCYDFFSDDPVKMFLFDKD